MSESTRNRGRLAVEISFRDKEILEKFQAIVPFYSSIRDRTRTTNFAANHTSSCWSVCSLEFRNALKVRGFTVGKKSFTQELPRGDFLEVDYYRGLVDGDGSLGVTGQGLPFLSFVTCSEDMAYGYIDFLESITGQRKTTSRNKRDGAYNIAVFKEDGQDVISKLYYSGCLALERKAKRKQEILNWARPADMRRLSRYKKWDDKQDAFILNHSLKDSMLHLTRSEKSVKMRLWKLKKERELS